jgi:hypothetical protein
VMFGLSLTSTLKHVEEERDDLKDRLNIEMARTGEARRERDSFQRELAWLRPITQELHRQRELGL